MSRRLTRLSTACWARSGDAMELRPNWLEQVQRAGCIRWLSVRRKIEIIKSLKPRALQAQASCISDLRAADGRGRKSTLEGGRRV